jgi:hypothetical protein
MIDPKHYRALFFLLLFVGAVERGAAAWGSNLGIAFADEHQQYLEQAFRQVHGYGMTFWEQSWGMRHLLYSNTLAGLLHAMEWFGIVDPFTQSFLLRFVLSQTVFFLIALYAWRWLRDGHESASLFLMFLLTASVDVIYIQVRLLSENAMAAPLMIALLSERRFPRLAGIFWMLMFAIRFQSAFLILGLVTWHLWNDRRNWKRTGQSWKSAFDPSIKLIEGLLLGTLVVGVMDWWHFGTFLHTPIMYFQANIVMNKAAGFGVEPWHYYFVRGAFGLLAASVAFGFLLWAARKVESRFVWMSLLFLLGHSAVGHKEMRFLWALLPLGLIVAARGFEEIMRLYRDRPAEPRPLWHHAGFIVATFLLSSALRGPFLYWTNEPYRSASEALAWLHNREDVRGIAAVGMDDGEGGNQFYLRRPEVWLLHRHKTGDLLHDPDFRGGRFNYMMVPSEKRNYGEVPDTTQEDVAAMPIEKTRIATIGKMHIYRICVAPRVARAD